MSNRNRRGGNDPVLPADLANEVDAMPTDMRDRLAQWDIIHAERHAASKSLSEQIDDWKAAILADGSTPQHAEKTTKRARKLFDACGFMAYSDLSFHDVLIALAEMRKDKAMPAGKVKRGISPQTSNSYLQAVKQFAVWMIRNKRATQSPLVDLGKLNVDTDRRHDRRTLAPDELRWLLDTTATGPERFGMTGDARATLYRLAAETGLRAGELPSLTRSSFRLDGDQPSVSIAAAYAKNRRQDTLPLRMNTAATLARNFAGKMPTVAAFTMPPDWKVINMLTADLADARTIWIAAAGSQRERAQRDASTFLAYKDDQGRCAHFRALRHTFISNLAAGGVHPKTAQRLARHSMITLTMDRYTHLRRKDLAGALDALPDLSGTRQAVAITGTDDVRISVPPSVLPRGGFQRISANSCGQLAEVAANTESQGDSGENAESSVDSVTGSTLIRTGDQGYIRPFENATTAESFTTSKGTPDSLSPVLSVYPTNGPRIDADLGAVIAAWPTLPGDVRKMIRGVVKATVEASKARK